jgi:anaerobic magnesium-protoporphyrin IX monomethyl ester cyclase
VSVVLVYPPAAEPSQPYSSLPSLAAFLRERGWPHVRQLDLNVELCRELLCRRGIERALERISARIESGGADGEESLESYGRLVRAALSGPFVADEIDDAVAELDRIDCYAAPDRLDRAKRTLFDAFQVLNTSNELLAFDPKTAHKRRFGSVAEIAAAVANPENPYRSFFRRRALPRISTGTPSVVGISITYQSQIVAAFTLAKQLRESLPGTRVVAGGQVVSQWHDALPACPEIFDWFDYLIAFEGETPLDRLLGATRAGTDPGGVPGLVWRDAGSVRRNPPRTEDVDELPTPDYRGLPLAEYFAPEPVFLLSTSRGCYWGRCAFCSVSPAFRGGYRPRHPDLVHRDVQTLVERHDAHYVSFADDCVSPRALRDLAQRLETSPRISWQCETRFEPGISDELLSRIRRAGCVNLVFGLESYSPRVLKSMSKGVATKQIDRILAGCRRSGIAVNLQFFFGFPGETPEEARATARFALEQASGRATLSFGVFNLIKGSRVERDPGAFGLTRVDRSSGPLAAAYAYEPEPAHARAVRSELQEALRGRERFPHLGLSLNAHSQIYFAETARRGGVELYRPAAQPPRASAAPANPLALNWTREEEIMADRLPRLPPELVDMSGADLEDRGSGEGHILAYHRKQDRIVELSRFGLWLLQRLDGTVTTQELVTELAAAAAPEAQAGGVEELLASTLAGLASRGFVTPTVPADAARGPESRGPAGAHVAAVAKDSVSLGSS